jgi:hypothetical protein
VTIEELVTGEGLQAGEYLQDVVLQIVRELLGARVFVWPREVSCETWTAFYRWMERGSVLSQGPFGSPCMTREPLVHRVWLSPFCI